MESTAALRRSFRFLLVGFPSRNEIVHAPPTAWLGRHRWCHAKRAVNLDEVVREVAKRNSGAMVLDLFRERVGKPGETAARHADGEVVALHVAVADVLWIGIAKSHHPIS